MQLTPEMKNTAVDMIKKNKLQIRLAALLCVCSIGTGLAGCGNSPGTVSSSAHSESTQEKKSAGTDAAESAESDAEPVTNDDGSVSEDVYAMDTYMSVRAYGEQASEAVKAAAAEIHRLDDLLSTGKTDSEISKINADSGGTVSSDTEYLVERSLSLYKDTDGAFDIAIYPVMQLWGFPTKKYRVPGKSEIEDALKLTDASKIHLDNSGCKLTFDEKGMEIDLGGIAKGYTSSRIMDIFKQYRVTSGLVSLGGNVQTYKKKTDGSSWRVAVEDPDDSSAYLGILSTSDKAVITSGGYERYFRKNGKTYHHIIDPKTGYPADSGIHSSTIISADGTLADGLSTSLFIMGLDKAEEFWKNHSDQFDFVLETDDGKLYVTEGAADSFSSDREVEIVRK